MVIMFFYRVNRPLIVAVISSIAVVYITCQEATMIATLTTTDFELTTVSDSSDSAITPTMINGGNDNSTELTELTTESINEITTTMPTTTSKDITSGLTSTTLTTTTTIKTDPVTVVDFTSESFNQDCLNVHNQFRALHGVGPLKMDKKLVVFARQRAATLARINDTSYLRHDSRNYGENLAAWPLFGNINCSEVSQIWFDEYKYVSNWSTPDAFTPYTYHFTQIVWSTTQSMGCGMASLEGSSWLFICCNYDPPGNYLGEFGYNVKPPIYLNETVNEVQHPSQIGKNCKCTCEV